MGLPRLESKQSCVFGKIPDWDRDCWVWSSPDQVPIGPGLNFPNTNVDTGGTSGTAVGLVSMVGSWTAGLASTGIGASDSQAARQPDDGGVVELCSTMMVG